MENNNKKFYILNSSGEMEAYSIVELTDTEYAVLKKVFETAYNNTMLYDSYSGNSYLFDKGFDTKEEAIECIRLAEKWDTPHEQLPEILTMHNPDAPDHLPR